MESHFEETLHKCFVCKKSFSKKGSLITHLRVHNACSLCGKLFGTRGTLNNHMLSHSKELPHKCSICGKGFKLRGALQIHLRVHTGERPYTCYLCSRSFTQSSSLATHMNIHNNIGPHRCSICGISFKHRQALKRHKTVTHKAYLGLVPQSQSHQEILSRLTTADQGARGEGVSISRSALDGENLSYLHNSEVPYIINVIIEEDG